MVPAAFNKILQWLIKTLTETTVITEPEEEKEDSVSTIVDATLTIQNRLISERATGQEEIKAIINSMIPQVSGNIEAATMSKITAAIIPHFQRVNEILQKHSAQIAKLEDSKDLEALKARVAQLEKESNLNSSSDSSSDEEIDTPKISDLEAKTDFKYLMPHPYEQSLEIEATLELCTTNKGSPYGPALITYENDDSFLSFKGLGTFNKGQLHLSPFTCINGYGYRFQIARMIDGRPMDNGQAAGFNPD